MRSVAKYVAVCDRESTAAGTADRQCGSAPLGRRRTDRALDSAWRPVIDVALGVGRNAALNRVRVWRKPEGAGWVASGTVHVTWPRGLPVLCALGNPSGPFFLRLFSVCRWPVRTGRFLRFPEYHSAFLAALP